MAIRRMYIVYTSTQNTPLVIPLIAVADSMRGLLGRLVGG